MDIFFLICMLVHINSISLMNSTSPSLIGKWAKWPLLPVKRGNCKFLFATLHKTFLSQEIVLQSHCRRIREGIRPEVFLRKSTYNTWIIPSVISHWESCSSVSAREYHVFLYMFCIFWGVVIGINSYLW